MDCPPAFGPEAVVFSSVTCAAEAFTPDWHRSGHLTQNVPVETWDLYGNRLLIVVGYVTCKTWQLLVGLTPNNLL